MLLAFDATLPQRDRLLNPNYAGEVIGRSLADDVSTIQECVIRRVKYRIGVSLRVLYDLRINGRFETVSMRAFPDGEGEPAFHRALARLYSAASSDGLTTALGFDRKNQALMFRYPSDRKIVGPAQLETNPHLLSTFFGQRELRLVRRAYAPEKSATFAVHGASPDPIAFVKTYAYADAIRSCRTHQRIATQSARVGILAPAVFGFVEQLNAVILEPMEGRQMVATGTTGVDDAAALGAALARLHRARPSPSPFRRLQIPSLRKVAHFVGLACPEVKRISEELLKSLEHRVPECGPDVCLHGDVHPKNVLIGRRGVAFVDFDQSAAGPAAADIGSFLAALEYGAQLGVYERDVVERMEDRFLTAYDTESSLPSSDAIRWFTAAALLGERAMRAVNRVRPTGLEKLEPILQTALALS